MKITKKVLSMILAFVLVLGLLPVTALATEASGEYVYLSISFDGKYIDDQYGNPVAYFPVPLADIAAVDLTAYGLENMWFDGAMNEDGTYKPTALQLLIYAHEELYGGDWSDVNFDAIPGSSYFAGGIFGFTENLVYFHNGDFPVDETQQSDYMTIGATSDRIVLEAGDFLDVASFSCYGFLWDQAGGFHLFADENGSYVHDYNVEKGQALPIKLMHSFCDLMYGEAWVYDATDYEVFYGATFGEAEGSVITDGSGCAEITFPEAGTYYVWCDGGHGSDDGTHGSCDYYLETYEPCIVSAPAYAKVTVTGADVPEEPAPGDTPIVKFNFSGSTMTLGNELVLNFVFERANVTGTDNYAVVTVAREGGDYTYEIPQSDWKEYNDTLDQISVNMVAKEMTDDVTVVIYNAAGEAISNERTDSIVGYCDRMFENSTDEENKTLAVDMLNYGAAAQVQFTYKTDNLANANLTEDQKALATVVTDMNDASKKGAGCAGGTLTLEDKILLNFVYNNSTIDNAAYATVSYVDHYNTPVSYNIEAADFKYFNDDMKMIQINTLVVADCRTLVCVELFDAEGNSLSVSQDSVESYTARSGKDLFKAILAFGDSAYAKFH